MSEEYDPRKMTKLDTKFLITHKDIITLYYGLTLTQNIHLILD